MQSSMTYHRYCLVEELYYSFVQDYQMHEHIVRRFLMQQHYVLPEGGKEENENFDFEKINFTSDWSRSETIWSAWARALAFARIASASPVALLICSSLKPSLAKIVACLVPSALFICASRIPSLSRTVARLRL